VGTYDRTDVVFGGAVARILTAESRRHIPIYLPHSGPARYDNNAISAVGMDGATGFGVMEWASVLTNDQLSALTEDAAAS